jgi:hypothetical protein
MFVDMERLTDGLWFERESASSSVFGIARLRPGRSGEEIEPVLRFRRGAMNGRRLHVDLVLLGGDRSVEVSFHPAATVDLVHGHAQRRGHDGNGWLGALLAEVVADAVRWGSWTPADVAASVPFAVLGGVAHPLLGAAYDAGVAPAAEIPRWASGALAESSMAACAARLFGAAAVTRSVVRALGRFLLLPVPDWWQLAACCAGAAVLSPDEIAAALVARRADATAGESRLPNAEDVTVLRAGFVRLERTRAKRLLVDSVRTGAASTPRLARVLRSLVEVEDDLRWPPPVRFADLEAVCLRAAALDPATVADDSGWAVPRVAPATRARRPVVAGAAFDHSARARDLDGAVVGDLELVLPRTAAELHTWGRLLDNCLGDFAAAVTEGRSTIVGVRERGRLVAALELRPDRRSVVQFLARRNRVPPASVTSAVIRHLAGCGLVSAGTG